MATRNAAPFASIQLSIHRIVELLRKKSPKPTWSLILREQLNIVRSEDGNDLQVESISGKSFRIFPSARQDSIGIIGVRSWLLHNRLAQGGLLATLGPVDEFLEGGNEKDPQQPAIIWPRSESRCHS